jgi:hypothetical protein
MSRAFTGLDLVHENGAVWRASRLVHKNNFLASWNKTEAAVDSYLGVSGRIHLS